MNDIFILIGPTASGKSNLAIKLVNKFPFEIINADLFSAYRNLSIGTAKPTKEELNKYKHCLLYTSPSPRDVEESRMPSSA